MAGLLSSCAESLAELTANFTAGWLVLLVLIINRYSWTITARPDSQGSEGCKEWLWEPVTITVGELDIVYLQRSLRLTGVGLGTSEGVALTHMMNSLRTDFAWSWFCLKTWHWLFLLLECVCLLLSVQVSAKCHLREAFIDDPNDWFFFSASCSLTSVIPQIFLEALMLISNWALTCVLPLIDD